MHAKAESPQLGPAEGINKQFAHTPTPAPTSALKAYLIAAVDLPEPFKLREKRRDYVPLGLRVEKPNVDSAGRIVHKRVKARRCHHEALEFGVSVHADE